MNYKQFRDTLKEQKLKHHDKVRVMLHKADGGQGYIIGIINLKVNPCELCISYDHNNTGKIDHTTNFHKDALDAVCGATFNDVDEWKYNYCPNCGTKMK